MPPAGEARHDVPRPLAGQDVRRRVRADRRACGGGTSEHTEGRAFDWTLDASRRADRKRAQAFLAAAFRTDRRGNTDALARRMGIMYVIWNDRMYSAWNEFEPEPYLSSGCKSRRKCSTTLRHRDHVHISLSRKGGRGATSWYDGRLPRSECDRVLRVDAGQRSRQSPSVSR